MRINLLRMSDVGIHIRLVTHKIVDRLITA